MKKIDLSIILTFHSEDKIAKDALDSVVDSIGDNPSFSYEIIAHIDKGTDSTIKIVSEYAAKNKSITILKNSFGDLSLSRNAGAEKANGEFIIFLDGDDIISKNFISNAFESLQQNPDAIFHPEYNITFGSVDKPTIWKMKDSYSTKKDRLILLGHNRWCATVALSKKIALATPYRKYEDGFGYEDWTFNIETRNKNIEHKIVKNTAVFYRISENSLFKDLKKQKRELTKLDSFSLDSFKNNGASRLNILGVYARMVNNKIRYKLNQKPHFTIPEEVSNQWKHASDKYDLVAIHDDPLFYQAEQDKVGIIYSLLVSELSNDNKKTAVDFKKYIKLINDEENNAIISALVIQNNFKEIQIANNPYTNTWVSDHDALLKKLKVKITQ